MREITFKIFTHKKNFPNREMFGTFLDKNVRLFLVPARCTLLLEIIAQSNVRPLRKTDLIDINP